MTTFAWIVLLGMMTFFFSRYLQQQRNPNQQVVTSSNTEYQEVVLQRNRYGHYYAMGKINHYPVEFMLDTGATIVSIPAHVAAELGLNRGPSMEVNTANGTISVYATRLEQVQIGNIILNDVRASINPYMVEDEILLGMSFLKQLEFTQKGEQLILRQY